MQQPSHLPVELSRVRRQSMFKVAVLPQVAVLAGFVLAQYGQPFLAAAASRLPGLLFEMVAFGVSWPLLAVCVLSASMAFDVFEQRRVLVKQVAAGFARYAASDIAWALDALKRRHRRVTIAAIGCLALAVLLGAGSMWHARSLDHVQLSDRWPLALAFAIAAATALLGDAKPFSFEWVCDRAVTNRWNLGRGVLDVLEEADRAGRLDHPQVQLNLRRHRTWAAEHVACIAAADYGSTKDCQKQA